MLGRTTETSTNTNVQTDIRFDLSYFCTLPGVLKVGQLVLNILGFICVITSKYAILSRGGWFSAVSMGGFIFTGIMLALYLFHIVEKLYRIPWLKIEFAFCTLWILLYLIAASLCADYGYAIAAFGAVSFFGFSAMLAYGFDAFLKYKAILAGEIAQGERSINVQV